MEMRTLFWIFLILLAILFVTFFIMLYLLNQGIYIEWLKYLVLALMLTLLSLAAYRNYLLGKEAGLNRYRDWKEFRESVRKEVNEFVEDRLGK